MYSQFNTKKKSPALGEPGRAARSETSADGVILRDFAPQGTRIDAEGTLRASDRYRLVDLLQASRFANFA